MSNKQITMAYKIPIKTASEKMVLLKLADNASDEGVCFPSLKTISRQTGVGKSTLIGALQVLEATGLIERCRRTKKNGADSSTEYTLHLPEFRDKEFNQFFEENSGIVFNFMAEYKLRKETFLRAKKEESKRRKTSKGSETDHHLGSETDHHLGSETDHHLGSETDHATISNPQSSFNPHSFLTKKTKEEHFKFNLSRNSQYENLSEEYKANLEAYAKAKDNAVEFENFLNYNLAKGSVWKDWSRAYNTWLTNAKKFNRGKQKENDAVLNKPKNKNEMLKAGNW